MNAGDRLAFGLDRLDERLEVAAPARGDDVIALTRESPGDGAAQKIASPPPPAPRPTCPPCGTSRSSGLGRPV